MEKRSKVSKLKIFKKGSKTYYNSARFFKDDVKKDVITLYSFVRVADNLVDSVPQKINEFLEFRNETERALRSGNSENTIINDMVELSLRRGFKSDWIMSFLKSMEMDLYFRKYTKIEETVEYMYGSAEVIGLMMSRIMELPYQALFHARMLGRTMQFINFIRDIAEDISLGRQYIPQEDLERFGLNSLDYDETSAKKENFKALMRFEIERFREWNRFGEEGFAYIDSKNLLPVKVATDMYLWTAKKISKDPFVVYRKKVKPSKIRILADVLRIRVNSNRCVRDIKGMNGKQMIETEFERAREEIHA